MDVSNLDTATRRFYYRREIGAALTGASHEDALAALAVVAGALIGEKSETREAALEAAEQFGIVIGCCTSSSFLDDGDDVDDHGSEVH